MQWLNGFFFQSNVRRIGVSSGVVTTAIRSSFVAAVSMLFGLGSISYSQCASNPNASKSLASGTVRSGTRNVEPESSPANSHPCSPSEVEQLRGEVGQLRAEIDRLRALIEAAVGSQGGSAPGPAQVVMKD